MQGLTLLPAVFIRTSLAFLLLGSALGAWMLAGPAIGLSAPAATYAMHIHFLVEGFLLCMVMGVALWMFPAPPGESGRTGIIAREHWGWWAYGLLVPGLLLRAVDTMVPGLSDTLVGRIGLVLAAALPVAAVVCFGLAVWARTKPRNRPWLQPPPKA